MKMLILVSIVKLVIYLKITLCKLDKMVSVFKENLDLAVHS